MVTIHIPTPLRNYTEGRATLDLEGTTVGEILNHMVEQFPDLKQHLFDEQGHLRPFVNIFVNDEDIRHREGLNTPVKDGDTVSLIPSIAGGCSIPSPSAL